MNSEPNSQSGMTIRTLVPFLAITFSLTWGIAALLILFNDEISAIFGEFDSTNPLYILAVYAPAFAGVFLVWREYGIKGLGKFFRRLTLWRAPTVWWVYLLLGIPVIVYIGAALKGVLDEPFPFSPWTLMFPALAHMFFLGTLEEFGWRGIALPLLQRKYTPFWAGLILGIIWATWHIPAFLMSGLVYSSWSFVPFFVGVVAVSIIMTPLFNVSRGSLLIAYLYHFLMMNPIFPDVQPYDNWLFVGVAAIVVWLNRASMFTREGAVTEVLAK